VVCNTRTADVVVATSVTKGVVRTGTEDVTTVVKGVVVVVARTLLVDVDATDTTEEVNTRLDVEIVVPTGVVTAVEEETTSDEEVKTGVDVVVTGAVVVGTKHCQRELEPTGEVMFSGHNVQFPSVTLDLYVPSRHGKHLPYIP